MAQVREKKEFNRNNASNISITPRNNNPRKEGSTVFRGHKDTVSYSKVSPRG